jgi:hypothetical protein
MERVIAVKGEENLIDSIILNITREYIFLRAFGENSMLTRVFDARCIDRVLITGSDGNIDLTELEPEKYKRIIDARLCPSSVLYLTYPLLLEKRLQDGKAVAVYHPDKLEEIAGMSFGLSGLYKAKEPCSLHDALIAVFCNLEQAQNFNIHLNKKGI